MMTLNHYIDDFMACQQNLTLPETIIKVTNESIIIIITHHSLDYARLFYIQFNPILDIRYHHV